MSDDDRRDLPPANSPQFLDRVREILSTYLGRRGDPLNRGVILRDLTDADLVTIRPGWKGGGSPIGGIGGAVGSGDSTPDLTPPPTPTGVTITPTFSNLIIEHDAPHYLQGHGHARTRVYGTTYSGSGPLPIFTDAVLLTEFTGTVFAHPTTLGTIWHLWLTWVTNDGVESTTPSGGTNGHAATTGLVGSSDLGTAIVLAQALAPGSVTADKAALDIGGDNLVGNNSFEVDADGDGLADGWIVYNNDGTGVPTVGSRTSGRISGYAQRVTWAGTNASTKGVYAASQVGVRGGWKAGKTYVLSFYARGAAAQSFGMKLEWNVVPATTVALKNPNIDTTWQRYAWRITWGGSVEGSGAFFLTIYTGAAWASSWVEFDDVQVEEGDTLSGYQGKLALNTIVAGDGAVANFAITNALIANLAVDNAKIADMSVAKLTAGSLQVGAYLRSTSYVAGTSGWAINADGTAEMGAAYIRGQLVASQIDTRNLTIKDGSGTVLFGSGTNLASTYINPASGWLNSNVSISSSGALSGAGGGTVTIGGLGYSGDLNATYGASWGSTLTGRPSNLAGLSGSEAIKNGDITITIGAGGSLSASGGPSVSGAVTLSGLGAGAMAFIAAITSANVTTYIGSAAIGLSRIDVASIGTLSAMSSYLGTVEIATGGYLRSGQTAWSTGSGFWLGWVGSGPGEPGFSIGGSAAYLRYKPSTGLELKLDTFTASFSSGAGGIVGVTGNGTKDLGYIDVSVSGGVSPYSYVWSISSDADTSTPEKYTARRATGTADTRCDLLVTSTGTSGAGVSQYVDQTCTVTDSNGRVAVVSVGLRVDWNGGTP